jgi:hypothetical protein
MRACASVTGRVMEVDNTGVSGAWAATERRLTCRNMGAFGLRFPMTRQLTFGEEKIFRWG